MTNISEQIKDWWIKGFQLNNVYLDDWDEIKSHFSRYGLNINEHGPIITMNELKYVREAIRLTEMLSNTPEYRELADGCNERERKGKIFMLNMYTYPYFSRIVSTPMYEKWVETPDKHLKKIFNLNGTMKMKDQAIEEIVRKAIIFLRKK
jgi:hypothetical protein